MTTVVGLIGWEAVHAAIDVCGALFLVCVLGALMALVASWLDEYPDATERAADRVFMADRR